MTFDALGPGLHVLREAEPLKRAGVLAVNLRADLCVTVPQVEAMLAERLALPRIDSAALVKLEELARRVARSRRIADRTREAAEVEVGHRLAASGTGLAVHPATIKERAASVEGARAALVEAEQEVLVAAAALAQAQESYEADKVAASEAAAKAEVDREAQSIQHVASMLRARRSRSLGAIVSSFGVALILLAVGVPLWAALVPALVSSLWSVSYLRPRPSDGEDIRDRAEAFELLTLVTTSTDDLFEGRRPLGELEERSSSTEARRATAVEELRVAERSWQELAGEGIDIGELEAVVRRYDPQLEDARLLAAETVGVRTADLVLRLAHERWAAVWSELGLQSPDPDAGEAEVRELAARVSRAVVLVGPATARAEDLARAAPAAAVVVIDGPSEPESLSDSAVGLLGDSGGGSVDGAAQVS